MGEHPVRALRLAKRTREARRTVPRRLSMSVGIIGLATALAACSMGGSQGSGGSGAGSSASGTGSVNAGLQYYKGKKVVLIVPADPGTSFDFYGRQIAPLLAKYLGATVNVENVPAGNTIVGQNTLAAASPNGLTIGMLNGGEDISDSISHVSGLNFDPQKESFLGAEEGSPFVWVAQPGSNLKTWKDMVQQTNSFSTLDVTSGTANLYLRSVYGAYGVKSSETTGYTDSTFVEAGFLRNDGPVAMETVSVFQDAIEQGKARPVLLTNPPPAGQPVDKYLAGVPTIAQEAVADPPATAAGTSALAEVERLVSGPSQIIVAPTGTPASEVDALRAAVAAALSSPAVRAAAAAQGLGNTFIPGPEAQQEYAAQFAGAQVLAKYLSAG